MEATTVKIHKNTKFALESLKRDGETYEEIINRLISEKLNKNMKKELIDAYKNMGKKDLEILEEWENASNEL